MIRTRSPENVADEIEECISKFHINYLNFRDSTFTINKKRIDSICNEIIQRRLDIAWDCNARVNTASFDSFQKMARSGCKLVTFGIESGSQKILDNANKQINLNHSYKAVLAAKKAGLKTLCYFMFGLPGETKQTAANTIKLAKKLNPDFVQFSIATPYPGTPFYDYTVKNNLLNFQKWSDFSLINQSVVKTKNFTADELVKINKKAYSSFYLRPSYVLKKISQLNSFEDLKRNMGGLCLLLKQILGN